MPKETNGVRGHESAPKDDGEPAVASAKDLIDRGQLDPDDYRRMLRAIIVQYVDEQLLDQKPNVIDNRDFVPRLIEQNQAKDKPTPREVYTAYIACYGTRALWNLAGEDVERGYVPELAEEIGVGLVNSLDRDGLLSDLAMGYDDIELNPRFRRAVAQYGGEFSQWGLFHHSRPRDEQLDIDSGATAALQASGSRYAPGETVAPLDQYQIRANYSAGLDYICQQFWSEMKQAEAARDEAVRAAWEGVDQTEPDDSPAILAADEQQWRVVDAYLEQIDRIKAARQAAVDDLVARGPQLDEPVWIELET